MIKNFNNRFMEKIIRLVIFFFLFSALVEGDCPVSLYPRKTIIGYINAQIDYGPNLPEQKIYQYAMDQQLSEGGIGVAIGIVGLQLNPNNIVDFLVSYTNNVTSATRLLFNVQVTNKLLGWRQLKFYFIASQSDIFLAGGLTTNQFSVGLDKKKYIVYRPTPKISGKQINLNLLQMKIFLNGVKLNQRVLNQQYNQMLRQFQTFKKFSSNTRLIQYFNQALQIQKSFSFKITSTRFLSKLYSFVIQTNADLISVSFSYIFFSRETVSEKHNYISSNFEFVGIDQLKITSLQNMDMLLTGITGFKLPRQNLYYFRLSINNLGGQSYFKLTTNFKYFDVFFTYFAFEMKLAYICQHCSNSPIIYQNKMCVEQCPRSYSSSEKLGIKFCQRCDIDKLKVIDESSGKCICAKRHYLQANENICKPCNYDCMTCDRMDKCLTCDNNLMQTRRKLTPEGRCKCPAIGFYDDKISEDIVCQACHPKCLSCYGPKAHNCLTCPAQKQIDYLGFCVCKNGFIEDRLGNCVCLPPNKVSQNNMCLDMSVSCGPNKVQQFVNLIKRCICKPGYIKVMEECIKCKQPAIFSESSLKCQCPKPRIQRNGQCISCETNKVYNELYNTCTCRNGTFQTSVGECIECPPRMILINEKCQCAFNYYEEKGICKRCQRYSDGPKCRRNIY